MKTHLCIKIEGEMKRIRDSRKTVLDATPEEAFSELLRAQKEGKIFYSGCSNMNQEGRCSGHPD